MKLKTDLIFPKKLTAFTNFFKNESNRSNFAEK